jgi:hypothetical protein
MFQRNKMNAKAIEDEPRKIAKKEIIAFFSVRIE